MLYRNDVLIHSPTIITGRYLHNARYSFSAPGPVRSFHSHLPPKALDRYTKINKFTSNDFCSFFEIRNAPNILYYDYTGYIPIVDIINTIIFLCP